MPPACLWPPRAEGTRRGSDPAPPLPTGAVLICDSLVYLLLTRGRSPVKYCLRECRGTSSALSPVILTLLLRGHCSQVSDGYTCVPNNSPPLGRPCWTPCCPHSCPVTTCGARLAGEHGCIVCSLSCTICVFLKVLKRSIFICLVFCVQTNSPLTTSRRNL